VEILLIGVCFSSINVRLKLVFIAYLSVSQTVTHDIVRGSATDSGVNKYIEKLQKIVGIYLEISREFLSGSSKYWRSLRALTTVSLSLVPRARTHAHNFFPFTGRGLY
jgi:hypothetical protein